MDALVHVKLALPSSNYVCLAMEGNWVWGDTALQVPPCCGEQRSFFMKAMHISLVYQTMTAISKLHILFPKPLHKSS